MGLCGSLHAVSVHIHPDLAPSPNQAGAGNLVLLEGLDATISKTATVCAPTLPEDLHIFRPLSFQTLSCVKIATEPLNPSELPKMVCDDALTMQLVYTVFGTRCLEEGVWKRV